LCVFLVRFSLVAEEVHYRVIFRKSLKLVLLH
jgi:hypothetical protein